MTKVQIAKLEKAGVPVALTTTQGHYVTAVPTILDDGNVKLATGRRGRPIIVSTRELALA